MNEIITHEEELRAEVEELKRQLAGQRKHAAPGQELKRPSALTFVAIATLLAALAIAGYFLGYLPRQRREQVLAAESKDQAGSLPVVTVALVKRSGASSSLVLPGNIQAIAEAPVLARASGYVKQRHADIGDRVKAGQVLAEIEAPELAQQILQARAAVDQANSTVEQAQAARQQGAANETMAHTSADRWQHLLDKGVVSRQENDTYQAQWAAQKANLLALDKAIAAARSNASAVSANVARLMQLQDYQTVRAPFEGVVTVRNIDTGVLVTEGATLLYRIAQTDRLRTYLNVPQTDAGAIRVGQQATLTIPNLPGRQFPGAVARTANALDPASRTMLVEVQVSNAGGILMPGMYAQVDLAVPRRDPPLVIPGDTLVVRSDGPQVAVVGPSDVVHFTRIQLGRDFGDRLEALSGLQEGQRLAVNPSDAVREGVKVKPVAAEKAAPKK